MHHHIAATSIKMTISRDEFVWLKHRMLSRPEKRQKERKREMQRKLTH
jgi:hypothetical protein